jgi:cytochrome c oxidase subunit 2
MFLYFIFVNFLFKNVLFLDVPENFQMSIQDPASPSLEGMLYFHDYLCFWMIQIGLCVVWFLIEIFIFDAHKNRFSQKFTHASTLEILWTIFPAIILLFIAVPSFALLYSLDELSNPNVTLKVIGHQWYWSYEYSDTLLLGDLLYTKGFAFDSYMIQTEDLLKGYYRLLEVDNRVVLPKNTHIRILITSADVLHSWAVPSLGIKLDACPGRISETSLFIKRDGTFYGQCSEICGVNHGFMPIVVSAVNADYYIYWFQYKSELALIAALEVVNFQITQNLKNKLTK